MHPLDLVKTRFQIQRGPEDPNRYTSIVDCFRKMYRNEGYDYNSVTIKILKIGTPKIITIGNCPTIGTVGFYSAV